jgi:hypothetical protein
VTSNGAVLLQTWFACAQRIVCLLDECSHSSALLLLLSCRPPQPAAAGARAIPRRSCSHHAPCTASSQHQPQAAGQQGSRAEASTRWACSTQQLQLFSSACLQQFVLAGNLDALLCRRQKTSSVKLAVQQYLCCLLWLSCSACCHCCCCCCPAGEYHPELFRSTSPMPVTMKHKRGLAAADRPDSGHAVPGPGAYRPQDVTVNSRNSPVHTIAGTQLIVAHHNIRICCFSGSYVHHRSQLPTSCC